MQLLQELIKIHSPSFKEENMSKFIQKKLKEMQIPHRIDEFNQIYNIITDTPLLSAHQDQVQKHAVEDIKIENSRIYGFNSKNKQEGLGADDKCGIWIILKLLEKYGKNKFSFIFSCGEESGGLLSKSIDLMNVDKCLYAIILDRKGSSDIIGKDNDYCITEFQNDISVLGRQFGYKPTTGIWSDADTISSYLSCVNLSVGYYNAHSKQEYIKWFALQNALNFTEKIINENNFKYEAPTISLYSNSKYDEGYEYGIHVYEYGEKLETAILWEDKKSYEYIEGMKDGYDDAKKSNEKTYEEGYEYGYEIFQNGEDIEEALEWEESTESTEFTDGMQNGFSDAESMAKNYLKAC